MLLSELKYKDGLYLDSKNKPYSGEFEVKHNDVRIQYGLIGSGKITSDTHCYLNGTRMKTNILENDVLVKSMFYNENGMLIRTTNFRVENGEMKGFSTK